MSRLSALGSRLWALGLMAVASSAVSLGAQQRTAPSAPQQLPRNLQVFLVTIGEGKYYWEKFGHNALWFYDPTRGVDLVFNWGSFDFNDPEFLKRTLLADNKYWVEPVPGPVFVDFYQKSDRTIAIQRLNLSQDQADSAFAYSRWNAQEPNKYYNYDYFRDNCSTRVRDVIDLALGGGLRQATERRVTERTYRMESVRLVDDMRLTQFGINVALGEPADKPLTEWEAMFVPSTLRRAVRDVKVRGADGTLVPVVAEEREIYQSTKYQERETMPSLAIPYLLVGLLLAAELVFIARAGERSRPAEIIFRVEATLLALIVGILGLVVLLAWLITQHVFWFRNENLLLLNPLALFLVALVPLAARRSRLARPAAICAVIIAMLAALALVLKGVPAFSQNNLAMILLLLPPHFAIAHALWRRAQHT